MIIWKEIIEKHDLNDEYDVSKKFQPFLNLRIWLDFAYAWVWWHLGKELQS